MSIEHTYGRDEWQTVQLRAMPVEQLAAEHAQTTVDEYRAKCAAEFKRRRLPVPDVPKPRRKAAKRK